jgi:serine/threonine protein kinase
MDLSGFNTLETELDSFQIKELKFVEGQANTKSPSIKYFDAVDQNEKSKRVVVKFIPEMISDGQKWKQDIDFCRELTWRENPNPSVLPYLKHFHKKSGVYIVYEYFDTTLERVLATKGILEEAEAVRIYFELVKAITALDGDDVTHRSIHPKCIYMTKNQQSWTVKLAGFSNSIKSRMGTSLIGSDLNLVSPVMIQNKVFQSKTPTAYSTSADLWPATVLLHRMVTGQYFMGLETYTDYRRIKARMENNYCEKLPFPEHLKISQSLKAFLRSTLNFDTAAYITSEAILNASIFAGFSDRPNALTQSVIAKYENTNLMLKSCIITSMPYSGRRNDTTTNFLKKFESMINNEKIRIRYLNGLIGKLNECLECLRGVLAPVETQLYSLLVEELILIRGKFL